MTYKRLLKSFQKYLDTHWVEPTISVVDNIAHLREDEKIEAISSPDELLGCSEQKVVSNQIILPNIMN